jgi:phosphopantothenoylcysteine synthetase/decarboxylase
MTIITAMATREALEPVRAAIPARLLESSVIEFQIAARLAEHALSAADSFISEPLTVDIHWPSGLADDMRTMIAAQMKHELQKLANRVAFNLLKATSATARKSLPIAIAAARKTSHAQ